MKTIALRYFMPAAEESMLSFPRKWESTYFYYIDSRFHGYDIFKRVMKS